ncbi:MAG TPA: hypothetical protein VJG67_03850 [Candidatus Paceibacterota bacterium]
MNQNPKMTPIGNLMYYTFILGSVFLLLYGLGGTSLILNAIGLVVGVSILGLILWAIFAIGERYGWWKEGFK